MVQTMNLNAVFVLCLIFATLTYGDEETGATLALLAAADIGSRSGGGSGGGAGGGGSGGGGAGGGSIFEQIFGAEANTFGGVGGNPFGMSFLQSEMGEVIGMLSLLQSMSSKASSKGSSLTDLTTTSVDNAGAFGGTTGVDWGTGGAGAGAGGAGAGGGRWTGGNIRSGVGSGINSGLSGGGQRWHTGGAGTTGGHAFLDTTGGGLGGFGGGTWGSGAGVSGIGGISGGAGFGMKGSVGSGWSGGSGGGGGAGVTSKRGFGQGFGGRNFGDLSSTGFGTIGGGFRTTGGGFGSKWGGRVGLDKINRREFGRIRPFPKSSFARTGIASSLSAANALSGNSIFGDLSGGFRGGGGKEFASGGSLNSNMNLNSILSALIAARKNNIALNDKIVRQKQTPIIIVGLESSGRVKHFGDGHGSFRPSRLDLLSQRANSFVSTTDRDIGFQSFPRKDAKDINLNIVVKQDRPNGKRFRDSKTKSVGQGLHSFGNNDLNLLDFNNIRTVKQGFSHGNGGGSKGPAFFSYKQSPDKHKSFSNVQPFWKDSSGARLKPIPKMVAQRQLETFIRGTNRGDMWNQIGANKGMAISENTAHSPGFLPVDILHLNPETQLEHKQQMIAYPKKQHPISNPIFKVPGHNNKSG